MSSLNFCPFSWTTKGQCVFSDGLDNIFTHLTDISFIKNHSISGLGDTKMSPCPNVVYILKGARYIRAFLVENGMMEPMHEQSTVDVQRRKDFTSYQGRYNWKINGQRQQGECWAHKTFCRKRDYHECNLPFPWMFCSLNACGTEEHLLFRSITRHSCDGKTLWM